VGTTTNRLATQYAARLALAQFLACVASTAIVIPLGGITIGGTRTYFTEQNVIVAVVLVVLGTAAVAVGGVVNITPTLRWFVPGREPSPDQRRAAMRLVGRQSAILSATWAVSGVVAVLLNLGGGAAVAVPTLIGVVLGAAAAVGTGLLLTQGALRPILAATTQGSEGWVRVPSVLARLVGMWTLGTALPSGVIAALILIRANGWIVEKNASVEIPVLVVTAAAMLLGLPIMILTSRSISDPVGEVVDAMAEVEQG
jgi:adenylate cyclase